MKKVRIIAGLLAVLTLSTTAVQAVEPVQEETQREEAIEAPTAEAEDWKLLLVNPWNTLPADYTVELRRLANGLQVDARIYDDLAEMLGDCWAAGLHPVVCSAYRPYSTQQRLYRNKIARLRYAGYTQEAAVQEAGRWVAVPGTSEHQTGMALDIVSYSYQLLEEKQEETAEQKWLMEHCWEYGFILRYPKDKTDITGIGYEPWHYRYVGRENAAAIQQSGLCLEEYLQILTSTGLKPAAETAAEMEQETASAVS